MPRSDYDLHGWPPSANIVCEFKPVHRARHVDIREDKTDFPVQFEQSNGSVGAARLIHLKAGVLDLVNRPHSDQGLVLHDQNRDTWPFRFFHRGGTPLQSKSSSNSLLCLGKTASYRGANIP